MDVLFLRGIEDNTMKFLILSEDFPKLYADSKIRVKYNEH